MINLTLGNATYDSIFIVREPRMLHQERTHKIWDIRFLNKVMDAMADGVFTLMTSKLQSDTIFPLTYNI